MCIRDSSLKDIKERFWMGERYLTHKEIKQSISQIEKQISSAGYQANNVAADKSAYDKLPRCCKVDG